MSALLTETRLGRKALLGVCTCYKAHKKEAFVFIGNYTELEILFAYTSNTNLSPRIQGKNVIFDFTRVFENEGRFACAVQEAIGMSAENREFGERPD